LIKAQNPKDFAEERLRASKDRLRSSTPQGEGKKALAFARAQKESFAYNTEPI